MSPDVSKALTRNYHLLAKPVGAACNLSCEYCFFLSKERLYPDGSRLMDEITLATYISQLMASSPGPEVQVSWQGGEPMLRGLDFYRRSVELAERYRRPHQRVLHTIQTNGTLVTDEWAAFFKDHGYLVGLSIDGPRDLHDAYRIDKKGQGTFLEAVRGWHCLRRHEVDVNVLCTIHAASAGRGAEVYRFFRDELQARYLQLIPIVERGTASTIAAADRGWDGLRGTDRPLYKQEGDQVSKRSIEAEAFGAFLIDIFDEWIRGDVGKVFVTTFDVALGSWLGQHNLCIVAPRCGQSLALEHNGDVYSCDHYVEPVHLIGNLRDSHLSALVSSEKQRRFGDAKYDTLPAYCKRCPVLFACYGECPRNRFIRTPDGEPGLNYLCAGYKAFFTHIDGPMRIMARLIELACLKARETSSFTAHVAPFPAQSSHRSGAKTSSIRLPECRRSAAKGFAPGTSKSSTWASFPSISSSTPARRSAMATGRRLTLAVGGVFEPHSTPIAMAYRPSKSTAPRGARARRGAEARSRLRRILSEASRQFLKKGYSGASLNDIIARSGGSKATIQKYFHDKAGLFAAVIAEPARQLVESSQLATTQGSPAQVLQAFGERVLAFYLRPDALNAYRGVIAEGHREARIAKVFYAQGHTQIVAALAARLTEWHEQKLVRSKDATADAERFLHILRAGLYEQTLIGLRKSHSRTAVSAQVEGSVGIFLFGLSP